MRESGTFDTAIPGLLAARTEVSSPTIRLYAKVPFHPYWTNEHDPYLGEPYNALKAPDRKIKGMVSDFNKDEFHWYTDYYNIFEAYRAQGYIPSPSVGPRLYSFSDAVRIEEWQFEFRYPNKSVKYPDGEVLDGIFEPVDISVNDSGKTMACIVGSDACSENAKRSVSNNILDKFRMRFLPGAVPKVFVNIYGSAAANYKLYYFNDDETSPKWVEIPARGTAAVADGLLGTWDVTNLNGENHTVVLRVPDPSDPAKFNQDYISLGIGSQIRAGQYARVFTPFKRASLLFDPNTLEGVNTDLITINQVKLDSADFKMPNGITPLGPIFDIKPDDIKIDPNFPVELNFVFTRQELEEMFGITDYSMITIYNLKDDNVLEPIATFRMESCSHPDPEDYGRHDGCLREEHDKIRFTGLLNHFSSYVIVKEGPVTPMLTSPLIYPRPAGWDDDPGIAPELKKPVEEYFYSDTVHFEGVLKNTSGAPTSPQSLLVRYLPKDNEAAISAPIYSNTDPNMVFDFDTGAQDLNGEYILRFTTRTESGIENSLDLPMLIDNSPPVSKLRFNGVEAGGEDTIAVNMYSIVELIASDVTGGVATAGVEKIEYRFNDGDWKEYKGPFTLVDVGLGLARLDFKATDKADNIEEVKTLNLLIVDANNQAGNAQLSNVAINMSGPSYSDGQQTWVNGQTEFSLNSDGNDYDKLEYQTEEGEFETYGGSFTLDEEEGFYIIDYFATDDLGVRGERNSKRVIVDNTPPISRYEFEGRHMVTEEGVFVEEETTMSMSAVDGGLVPSGAKRIEYRFDDGEWTTYDAPVSFTRSSLLCIRSVDNVDNYEVSPEGGECAHSLNMRYDDVMPQTSVIDATGAFSPNGDGIKDEASFKLYNSDNFAEVIYVTLSLVNQENNKNYKLIDNEKNDPGEFAFVWDGTLSGTPLPEGRYTYSFAVRDERGNLSNVETGEIVLDVTPPDVELIGSSRRTFSPNEDDVAEVMQVDYSVEDNLLNRSIKAGLIVFVDDTEIYRLISSVDAPPYQKSLVWNGLNARDNKMPDGNYTYTIYAEDMAGNRANEVFSEAAVQGSVFVDKTSPISDINIFGNSFKAQDGTIWLGPQAKVGFAAFDPMPGTGVDFITYSIDNSPAEYYVLPVNIAEGGVHTIQFGAADRVGNRENYNAVQAFVDAIPPESSLKIEGPQVDDPDLGLVVGRNTSIILNSTDIGSGVNERYIMLGGRPQRASYDEAIHLVDMEEGAYTLEYWSDDMVGNTEGVRTIDLYYDSRPPMTRFIIGTPQYGANNIVYIDKNTSLSFEVDSNRDDIESAYYRIDTGPFKTAEEFTISNEGEHTISYHSQDRILNIEEEKSQKVHVDNIAPRTTAAFSNAVSEKGIYYVADDTMINLTAADDGAGVLKTEYRWNTDAGYSPYISPFGLPGGQSALATLWFKSIDNLGHAEDEQGISISTQGLDVQRALQVVPRVLVIMAQSLDLRENDPRPNQALLDEVLSSTDSFYKILSTDKDSYSDIINEMMSGIYNIYIIATDAYAIRWDDRKEVGTLFAGLKAFVHNGESLITVLSGAISEGGSWESFSNDIDRGLSDGHYGKGLVARVPGNPGTAADRDVQKQTLKDIIMGSIPAYHQPSRGEVIDVQLSIDNKASYPVSANVETLGDETVLAKDGLPALVKIDADEKDNFNYLVRLSEDKGEHLLEEKITARWDNNLEQQRAVPVKPVALLDGVEERITKLYDKLYYEQDPAMVKAAEALGKLYHSLNNEEITPEEKVSLLLTALKEVGEGEGYESVRHEMETSLRLLGTHLSMKDGSKAVANYSSGPLDNLSFDTTQHAGEGGCSFVSTDRTGASEGILVFISLGLFWLVLRSVESRKGPR